MAVSADFRDFVLEQAATRPRYEKAGSRPFCPYPDRPDQSMGYWQVPAEVLEEPETLALWAREAKGVALAKRGRKRR
ncbi:MAG: TfoX/Sxy family protein [Geminicoccales bacterium]